MSVSLSISEDDAVWMLRVVGEGVDEADKTTNLIQKIGALIRQPEDFLSDKIDKKPMFKHVFKSKLQDGSLDSVFSLKDFFDDREIRGRIDNFLSEKDIEEWLMNMCENKPHSPLLFKWSEPIMVIFQYGNILNLHNGENLPINNVLVQGEYGTNTIRVNCPVQDSGANNINLDLKTQIVLSLTDTNICYIHYDLCDESEKAQSIFTQIAKIALFPGIQTKFMNEKWLQKIDIPPGNFPAKDAGNLKFSDEFKSFISIITHGFSGNVKEKRVMAAIEKKIKQHIRFKILGFDGVANPGGGQSRYEFIFQTKSRVSPPGTLSEKQNLQLPMPSLPGMSTCNKIISDFENLDALKSVIQQALIEQGYNVTITSINPNSDGPIDVYLDSGQMIRWILP